MNKLLAAPFNGALGGLNETNIYEDTAAGLAGTPYTMTWATPNSLHSDNTHTQFSNATGPLPFGTDQNTPFALNKIDWNDSESISAFPTNVTADINNYGFPGCTTDPDDPADPVLFDYDTVYHFDFKFLEGSSGVFDGVTDFAVEQTLGDTNLAVLNLASYEGIEQVGLTEFLEDGTGVEIAGNSIPIEIALLGEALDEDGNPILDLEKSDELDEWRGNVRNAFNRGSLVEIVQTTPQFSKILNEKVRADAKAKIETANTEADAKVKKTLEDADVHNLYLGNGAPKSNDISTLSTKDKIKIGLDKREKKK